MSFEDNKQKGLRRVRRDSRDDDESLVGYQVPDGSTRAWRGDEDAPYTAPLGRAASAGTTENTAVNEENQRLLVDEYGRLWVRDAGAGPTSVSLYHDSTANRTQVVSTTSGRLYQARMIVDTAVNADRFLQIFDRTTAPTAGVEPIWEALVPANSTYAEAADSFGPIGGLPFSNGLAVAVSSTPGVWTDPGSDDAFFFLSYSEG